MKIGLALAGGGLQGIAHIGVLKALEELNIKADYISGTSSGSLFALLYALGCDTTEMENMANTYYKQLINIEKTKIIKIIKDYLLTKTIKTGGLICGEKIENIVNDFATSKGITNINEIKIPLAIPTVDTISTKECIFVSKPCITPDEKIDYINNIPIGKAIRASMAFPGIFTTCDFEKYNFIDGGTKDNLPVKVLKDMGADFTIGISFNIDKYEPTENLFDIILRAVDIFAQKDVVNAQNIADIALEVDTHGASLLEIGDLSKCIETGYNTIMDNKEMILEKIDSKS